MKLYCKRGGSCEFFTVAAHELEGRLVEVCSRGGEVVVTPLPATGREASEIFTELGRLQLTADTAPRKRWVHPADLLALP